MVITYQGDNYFKIISGEFTLLVDPTNARALKGAHVVLKTISPGKLQRDKDEDMLWIENQGEYETRGYRIYGFNLKNEDEEKTAYLAEVEGIRLGILGHLTREPTPEVLEEIEGADILVIPAGGKPYISEVLAAKIVRRIEPGIVIPSLFDLLPKKFLAEFNQNPRPEEKLVLKKKDIQRGAMRIVCLEPK